MRTKDQILLEETYDLIRFQRLISDIPTDQLLGVYIEDLYTMYTGGLFDRHEQDKARQQIDMIKQELLSRGESEEKLNTIEDDIKEEIIADEEGGGEED